jgi:hypothetical protein
MPLQSFASKHQLKGLSLPGHDNDDSDGDDEDDYDDDDAMSFESNLQPQRPPPSGHNHVAKFLQSFASIEPQLPSTSGHDHDAKSHQPVASIESQLPSPIMRPGKHHLSNHTSLPAKRTKEEPGKYRVEHLSDPDDGSVHSEYLPSDDSSDEDDDGDIVREIADSFDDEHPDAFEISMDKEIADCIAGDDNSSDISLSEVDDAMIAAHCNDHQPQSPPDEAFSIKQQTKHLSLPKRLSSTASNLVSVHGDGVAVAVFRCPAPSCHRKLSRHCTPAEFYLQVHGEHADELFNPGHYVCEFGCRMGFADEHDRNNHYRDGLCIVPRFQVPSDDDPTDILRYTYLSEHVPAEKHFRRRCKTNNDITRLWQMYIRGMDVPTHFNNRLVSSRFTSVSKNSDHKSIMLHRIVKEAPLASALLQAIHAIEADDDDLSSQDPFSTDESESESPAAGQKTTEVHETLSQPVETDEESTTEDEVDEEVLSSRRLQDIKTYKAWCDADINHQHTTHGELQRRTASQMIGVPSTSSATSSATSSVTSSATFVFPLCRDIFDAAYVVYRYYKHLEDSIHWDYFAAHGLLCEFDCGRGFLDEHHRLLHYQSGLCTSMVANPRPDSFPCSRRLDAGEAGNACNLTLKQFSSPRRATEHWFKVHGKASCRKASHNCNICKMGFDSLAMYMSHF